MTRDTLIEAIHAVLRDEMRHPHLGRFAPEARLNEDLYLDSVQLLQIILALETKLSLTVSDETVSRQDIATVADLAALLLPEGEAGSAVETAETGEGVHGDMPYDLKIHCFVSCVCDGLKTRSIDHRPYYALIWDAEFTITDDCRLAYHSVTTDHESFRHWFERLYGVRLDPWYDPSRSKDENLRTLHRLLEARRESEAIMVMLDMFHLPERENKFNQNPFPHYLMLETTEDPEFWFVRDPDFRWDGRIERARLETAIRQPSVAGGYRFDMAQAHAPKDADLDAFFQAVFRLDANPLIDALRVIVTAHAEERDGLRLSGLAEALRELPVITIRKWAYEHGFAFFWRALKWPHAEFDAVCDEIEALVNGLTALHYQVLKLAKTQDAALAAALIERLDDLDATESAIKRRLGEAYAAWRAQALP